MSQTSIYDGSGDARLAETPERTADAVSLGVADEDDHLFHRGRVAAKHRGRPRKGYPSPEPSTSRLPKPRTRSAAYHRDPDGFEAEFGAQRSRSAENFRRHTGMMQATAEAVPDSPELRPVEEEGEETDREPSRTRARPARDASRAAERPPSPSVVSTLTSLTTSSTGTDGSSSSNDSASTVVHGPVAQREERPDIAREENPAHDAPHGKQHDAFSYLEPNSPAAVTEESIRRSVEESANWKGGDASNDTAVASPTARSVTSYSSASAASSGSVRSRNTFETGRSTSPEHSVNGDIVSTTFRQTSSDGQDSSPSPFESKFPPNIQAAQRRQQKYQAQTHRYGTPEMPRGSANHPHIPPNALQPRVPNQGHVKHLPRAEKLPLTGYELLATQLSSHRRPGSQRRRRSRSGSSSSPTDRRAVQAGESQDVPIKPIYRRFEALNHRLLLHLQDELSELEEQLHRLDTTDTQTRRAQNCILPASRRAEALAGGELQWHKTDILSKVGFKLQQYNHVLSSFTSTQGLPAPSMADVEDYRAYLAAHNPIVEIETRFLDPMEDLVSLAPKPGGPDAPPAGDAAEYFSQLPSLSDDALTPMPRKMSHATAVDHNGKAFLPTPSLSPSSSIMGPLSRASTASSPPEAPSSLLVPQLALATALAVLVPILTFLVIPGFIGRMAVVLLVGLATAWAQVNSGGTLSSDALACVAVYGGLMAAVAAVVS